MDEPETIRPLVNRRTLLIGAGATAGAIAGLAARSAFAAPAQLDVTQGNIQPISIALPDFTGGGANDGEIGRNVSAVITGNLRRSGLFLPVDPAAFIERVVSTDAVPRFRIGAPSTPRRW
jgi:TolB protein